MEKIILASNNVHKIKEFKELFTDYEIVPMKEIGFNEEIVENGTTFEENSKIKTEAISNFLKRNNLNYMVMADDSGLCVDALNGAPGLYSARYAGTQQEKIDKILNTMPFFLFQKCGHGSIACGGGQFSVRIRDGGRQKPAASRIDADGKADGKIAVDRGRFTEDHR